MPPSPTQRKYLAFDIETAKQTPGDFAQWRLHRPLGICCAATCADDGETKLWHSTTNGKFAPRMTATDLQLLVAHLCLMAAKGYTLLTWNGASFDFDVLAEESGAHDQCRNCVHDHVDMMFHIVCRLGYPISLGKVAEGLGIPGKAGGMTGSDAPKLWAAGKHDEVLGYVAQDVRLALQIASECEKRKHFAWITQKGMKKTEPLPGGWKTVREALKLPLPDTSWMKNPISRSDFIGWLTAN